MSETWVVVHGGPHGPTSPVTVTFVPSSGKAFSSRCATLAQYSGVTGARVVGADAGPVPKPRVVIKCLPVDHHQHKRSMGFSFFEC
jgi:hypothetical protein